MSSSPASPSTAAVNYCAIDTGASSCPSPKSSSMHTANELERSDHTDIASTSCSSQTDCEQIQKARLRQLAQTVVTSQSWKCPSHAIAPLPAQLGRMLSPYVARPRWFNNPTSCAGLPGGTQLGNTCGLHAIRHLLHSAGMYRQSSIFPPTRTQFESAEPEQPVQREKSCETLTVGQKLIRV